MKKTLLAILLLLSINAAAQKGQCTVGENNEVSNFKEIYNFYNCCFYDPDTKRTWNEVVLNTTVGININYAGKGTLTTFMLDRAKFYVEKCVKTGNNYVFTLKNEYGTFIMAELAVQNNIARSFAIRLEDGSLLMYY